jgi:phosphatidylserine synthase
MVNKLKDIYENPADLWIYERVDEHMHIYKKLHFSPNILTTISLSIGLFSAYQILQGNLIIAAILWMISYYFDCADGKFARKYNMVTKFGDIYDHASDGIKTLAVLYALIKTTIKRGKKLILNNKQWLYIGLILLLAILMFINLGYQECIYNTNESLILGFCRLLVFFDKNPHKSIQYTKYFGCGTFNLCTALIIIFWNK